MMFLMRNEKRFVNNRVRRANYLTNLSETDTSEENWNELSAWILREIE